MICGIDDAKEAANQLAELNELEPKLRTLYERVLHAGIADLRISERFSDDIFNLVQSIDEYAGALKFYLSMWEAERDLKAANEDTLDRAFYYQRVL